MQTSQFMTCVNGMINWHLPGGPVGPPARWAAASNVEGGSETDEEGAQGPLAWERGALHG